MGFDKEGRAWERFGRTGWWLLLGLTGVGAIPLLIWFCQCGRTDGAWTPFGFVPMDRQEPRMDRAGPGQTSVSSRRPDAQPGPTAFNRASDTSLLFIGCAACTVIALLLAMSWQAWKDRFIVTSLTKAEAAGRFLYERLYADRSPTTLGHSGRAGPAHRLSCQG